jgi:hypothetical protein
MDPLIVTGAPGNGGAAPTHPACEPKVSEPAPESGEIDGQLPIAPRPQRFPVILTVVYHPWGYDMLPSAGGSMETVGAHPRKDASGIQLCERCPARLCRTKGMKYQWPPGLICQVCYDKVHPRKKRMERPVPPEPATSSPEPPKPKRQRRVHSDPGERDSLPQSTAAPPAVKKMPVHKRVIVPSHLLAEAHVKRVILLAAEKNGTHSVRPRVLWKLIVSD